MADFLTDTSQKFSLQSLILKELINFIEIWILMFWITFENIHIILPGAVEFKSNLKAVKYFLLLETIFIANLFLNNNG